MSLNKNNSAYIPPGRSMGPMGRPGPGSYKPGDMSLGVPGRMVATLVYAS